MGQSSAGEAVRDLLKTSGFIKHSPKIDELIAYSESPEYAEEKAAMERAAQEAYEEEERARAELLRARREAVAVRMSRAATLPYADNRDKQSPVAVEAGEVVAVEEWQGDGWTARIGGIGVFVSLRIATPCEALREAETENDPERKPPMRGGAASPAQVENEGAESPRAGVSTAAATVAQGNAQTGEKQARNARRGQGRTPSEPRAKREQSASEARAKLEEAAANKERTKSETSEEQAGAGESWPWWWGKSDAAIRALLDDGLITKQGAVFMCLVCPAGESQWPVVWRDRASIAAALGIDERSVSTAIDALVRRGYLVKVGGGMKTHAARYRVTRFVL